MTIENIKEKLRSEEYAFLKKDSNLGNRIILLTAGGSCAYGTENENSDLDIRGCTLNSKRQILTGEVFEQFSDDATDTVIYSFNKLIRLLSECNPNTIELLGNKEELYFYVSPIGRELIDSRKMFLSKKAALSFGGYAHDQLRRLTNKSARLVPQTEQEEYILTSIHDAERNFKARFLPLPEDSIKLYIDRSEREDMESEIFMDANVTHYPLRDYMGMTGEMNNIVRSYSRLGKRNKNAVSHNKLAKHMMHLIRLYMMCIDIMEKEEIITYRTDEHELLMSIRRGDYLDNCRRPSKEFYELVDTCQKRMEYALSNTALPDEPDRKGIADFAESVNERVVRGDY